MLPRGARVTCYPGARVSHDIQDKAKQRKERERQAKQTKAKQKRSKSNCDARHVTCYPRAGVSHVTPGRACHMLPAFLDAGAGAKVVKRCVDQCSARTNRPYMCFMAHQPFSLPLKFEILKYHSPFSNHFFDTTCAKKRLPGWTWQKTISPKRTSLADLTGS